MGIPGAGLPGFPGLSPMASPLSLRPTGSFVPPTFQANLTPKVRHIFNNAIYLDKMIID